MKKTSSSLVEIVCVQPPVAVLVECSWRLFRSIHAHKYGCVVEKPHRFIFHGVLKSTF